MIVYINDDLVTIKGKCKKTGEIYFVTVKKDEWDKYNSGELAQNAFPDTSAENREFIISGISPKGWNKIFKK